jgi:hypothetical protein
VKNASGDAARRRLPRHPLMKAPDKVMTKERMEGTMDRWRKIFEELAVTMACSVCIASFRLKCKYRSSYKLSSAALQSFAIMVSVTASRRLVSCSFEKFLSQQRVRKGMPHAVRFLMFPEHLGVAPLEQPASIWRLEKILKLRKEHGDCALV